MFDRLLNKWINCFPFRGMNTIVLTSGLSGCGAMVLRVTVRINACFVLVIVSRPRESNVVLVRDNVIVVGDVKRDRFRVYSYRIQITSHRLIQVDRLVVIFQR